MVINYSRTGIPLVVFIIPRPEDTSTRFPMCWPCCSFLFRSVMLPHGNSGHSNMRASFVESVKHLFASHVAPPSRLLSSWTPAVWRLNFFFSGSIVYIMLCGVSNPLCNFPPPPHHSIGYTPPCPISECSDIFLPRP